MQLMNAKKARELVKKWVLEEDDTELSELSDVSDECGDVDADNTEKGIFGMFLYFRHARFPLGFLHFFATSCFLLHSTTSVHLKNQYTFCNVSFRVS